MSLRYFSTFKNKTSVEASNNPNGDKHFHRQLHPKNALHLQSCTKQSSKYFCNTLKEGILQCNQLFQNVCYKQKFLEQFYCFYGLTSLKQKRNRSSHNRVM
ncbi:hypothetical protein KIL84_020174 [Mauremys mutica]|uniref:Uncharacterized protein n=1 Tax=Mauremys mutica TaxID=74926 RepID=A0A9D4BBA5_9SAUR|nr:hypothetical protein KIL84_020174 [Mauremys mutica]